MAEIVTSTAAGGVTAAEAGGVTAAVADGGAGSVDKEEPDAAVGGGTAAVAGGVTAALADGGAGSVDVGDRMTLMTTGLILKSVSGASRAADQRKSRNKKHKVFCNYCMTSSHSLNTCSSLCALFYKNSQLETDWNKFKHSPKLWQKGLQQIRRRIHQKWAAPFKAAVNRRRRASAAQKEKEKGKTKKDNQAPGETAVAYEQASSAVAGSQASSAVAGSTHQDTIPVPHATLVPRQSFQREGIKAAKQRIERNKITNLSLEKAKKLSDEQKITGSIIEVSSEEETANTTRLSTCGGGAPVTPEGTGPSRLVWRMGVINLSLM